MKRIRQILPPQRQFPRRPRALIQIRRRPPMQCRRHGISTPRVRCRSIPARLGDVYFAGPGPLSVRFVLGVHPQERHQPVSLRHLGYDFDAPVFNGYLSGSGEARGAHRVDDRAVCDVAVARTLVNDGDGAGPVGGEVQGVAI